MKRVKNLWTTVFVFIIAVVLVVGGLRMPAYNSTLNAAYADSYGSMDLSNININSSVDYGDPIKMPSATGFEVTLKTPVGQTLASDKFDAVTGGYEYDAVQLGVYVVSYKHTASGLTYSFKVNSSLDKEFKLKVVDDKGVKADSAIPTYIKASDDKVKLPSAVIGYYNDDNEWTEYTDGTAKLYDYAVYVDGVQIWDSSKTTAIEYAFATAGTTYVSYEASVKSVNGNAGKKFYTKTFEVKVQKNFEDTAAPTISIPDVSSSASINQKVTLPKATAKDNFDAEPTVSITVKYVDASGNIQDVKEAIVNADGVATGEKTTPVYFDNDEVMSFYPQTLGDYKVEYKATDDSGNATSVWKYTITVADKKAPVMTINEDAIPSEWAWNTVNTLDAANKEVKYDDLSIAFPTPEFYDNYDKAEDVKIRFEIKDPDSRTVAYFDNINATTAPEYTSTVIKDGDNYKKYTFATLGSIISDYATAMAGESDATKAGVYEGAYTITYRASDLASNSSSKSFTINISETYKDNMKVNAEFTEVPEYVVADGKTDFVLPIPTISSATDSKLKVEYVLSSGAKTLAYTDFAGGETVTIEDGVLSYEDGDDTYTLDITGTELVLTATGTSHTGLSGKAVANIEVRTVDKTTALFADTNVVTSGIKTFDAYSTLSTVEIGQFVVKNIASADAQFVGIELGVKDEEGNYTKEVSAEIYNVVREGGLTDKIVRNITFKVATSGKYYFEARVFDINGNSKVVVREFEVKLSTGNGGTESPKSLISTATIEQTIKLAYESFKVDETYFAGTFEDSLYKEGGNKVGYLATSHTISGGRFSLMGTDLKAYTAGDYQVTDKPIIVDATANDTDYAGLDATAKTYLDSQIKTGHDQKVTVTDSSTVSFEVLGLMPTHIATLNAFSADLPSVMAYTELAAAEKIELTITNPNGKETVTMEEGAEANSWKFKPTMNGTYTLTYTVTIEGGKKETFKYTIKAGDVVAPEFTISGKHESRAKSGYKLKYLEINVAADTDDTTKLTYSKTVLGPDGEVVSGSEISGKGNSYRTKDTPTSGAIELTSSGKYTIRYEVTDEANNTSVYEEYITISGSTSGGGVSLKVLSTILIIIGALLIVGVIVYLVRYRRIKK